MKNILIPLEIILRRPAPLEIKFLTGLIVLFSFMLAFPAAAQVNSAPGRNAREGVRQDIRDARMDAKQQIQKIRQTTRQEVQNERKDLRETVKIKREEVRNTAQARRTELKAKLQNIKDERKKAAIERIDQNLAGLNSRTATHYVNVLNQIENVLKRVISRTDKAHANGKDVAAVRTAIVSAQNAIAEARAAVTTQAAKTYSIKITEEATLKNDVGAARKGLRDDLVEVQKLVKAARDAVRRAAVNLAQIRGIDKLEATSTAVSATTSTSQ